MGSLGVDFLPGNGKDVTGNLGRVDTVSRTLVPVDVLGLVLFTECTGGKWDECSALSLNRTTKYLLQPLAYLIGLLPAKGGMN